MIQTSALSFALHAVFYFTLLFVTLYSVFMVYHWFTFGASKHIATVAAVIYLVGAAFCVILMSVSLLGIS